ncbi:M23 family metallopeptidase [Cytobacillus sp. IB215665]|uniref:M23 family metallopeptidase n=1 Tax=Cytobacillus sp. IB215665 TaxID=3097357 RepID=UPI002A13A55A|nr:M23 family metallopeptidase [Cytobacillus sp. IB215665]MDX8363564.1 M23 family metallopeptidase [Cytobacillus sp. IB215665]
MLKQTNIYTKVRHMIKPVNFDKKALSIVKKAMVTTVAVATLTVGSVEAANSASEISTIYHVYVNGENIGTVDDKKTIEKAVNDKMKKMDDRNGYLEFSVGEQLTYIPEKVFSPIVNNETTAKKVKNNIEIYAASAAINVNGEPIAYFANEEEANEVLKKIKTSYVSAKELEKLELQQKMNELPNDLSNELPPLKEGESRIIDVSFDESVKVTKDDISPDNIITVDQGVSLLKKGTLAEKKYEIKQGDVLGSIANAHDLSTEELLKLNPDISEKTILQIGQQLNVTQYEPYVHVLVKEEHYKRVVMPFKTETIEKDTMYKGDQKVNQEGQNGEKLENIIIVKDNGTQIEKTTIKEEVTKEPVNKIIFKGTKVVPSRGTGTLLWPASGGYVSSEMGQRWGKLHKGMDIARPSNYTIKAADNGVVEFAGWDGGYGNRIVINHNNGIKTTYSHLSSISVSVGQTIEKGRKIGVMGSTGNSTGTHLHFEVYKNGSVQNPRNFLQ